VESNNYIKALDGLTMLQDELPAETSFYVPEIYHRRIIGVAGKNIQKVMKKYGVYVKFSGAEEFTALGGYFENEDNVVARTPMKNQINLENLKHSVTEFISFQKDKDYTFTTMAIPYTSHRTIPNQYGSQLREICRTNNAKIWWPERLGSDQVEIYGPQSQIPTVIMFMAQFITVESHIAIAVKDEQMKTVLLEQDFITGLQQSIKGATNMDLIVQHTVFDNENNNADSPLQWISRYDSNIGDVIIHRLLYKLGQEQGLHKAKDIIRSNIESKDLPFQELIAQKVTLPSSYTPPSHQHTTSFSNSIDNISNSVAPHVTDLNILDMLASSVMPPQDGKSFDHYAEELAMLDNMPSPPLSEQQQLLHPHDSTAAASSTSLLSAPQPTGKNIWASPRIQSNNVSSFFFHQLYVS
jgi:hypothetical protein